MWFLAAISSPAVGEDCILTAVLVCNAVCLADIMTVSHVASHGGWLIHLQFRYSTTIFSTSVSALKTYSMEAVIISTSVNYIWLLHEVNCVAVILYMFVLNAVF